VERGETTIRKRGGFARKGGKGVGGKSIHKVGDERGSEIPFTYGKTGGKNRREKSKGKESIEIIP